MSNGDKDYVILRTYGNVWAIDRKIYSVEGLKLLFPVALNELLYFTISIVISILLIKLVPFYKNLHFAIKFIFVPFGLMKFFTKQKLDGKMPLKFFHDYIMYKLGSKKFSRFRPVQDIQAAKFISKVTYRNKRIINKTEMTVGKTKGNSRRSLL